VVANPKHGDAAAAAAEEDLLQHRRTMKPHEVNSEVIILWCLLRLVVMVVFVLKNVVWSRVPRGGFEHLRLRQY
jgi:hypothetical protein